MTKTVLSLSITLSYDRAVRNLWRYDQLLRPSKGENCR